MHKVVTTFFWIRDWLLNGYRRLFDLWRRQKVLRRVVAEVQRQGYEHFLIVLTDTPNVPIDVIYPYALINPKQKTLSYRVVTTVADDTNWARPAICLTVTISETKQSSDPLTHEVILVGDSVHNKPYGQNKSKGSELVDE